MKDIEKLINDIGQDVQIFRNDNLIVETKSSIQKTTCFFKKGIDIKNEDIITVKISGEKLIVEKVTNIYKGNEVHHIEVKMK